MSSAREVFVYRAMSHWRNEMKRTRIVDIRLQHKSLQHKKPKFSTMSTYASKHYGNSESIMYFVNTDKLYTNSYWNPLT